MRTFIDERAPKTEAYVRYIFEEIMKYTPLTMGANIEIHIIENKTPFPKLVEIPEGSPNTKRMSDELNNWKIRHPGRFGLLYEFTKKKLRTMCTLLTPSLEPEIPLNIIFNVVIKDPEKIYRRAKELGAFTPDEDNLLKHLSPSVAKYYDNPPRIMWNGKIVPVRYSSTQKDVCEYAFGIPIKEHISWDKIIKKIDNNRGDNPKKDRQSIYYAVYKLNEKIKKLCKKPLFIWEEKSFYRIA